MIWPAFNAAVSAVLGLIIAYKLMFLHHRFTLIERVGMGMLGAGCVLTIGPILWPHESPYENWSGFLFRTGCCVFFIGRVIAHDLHGRRQP